MPISDLEKTAVLQILIYLSKKEKATRTDLRKNIKAAMETIYSAINILKTNNLIEIKKSHEFPFAVTTTLTKKGRKVAELLVEIEKILEE